MTLQWLHIPGYIPTTHVQGHIPTTTYTGHIATTTYLCRAKFLLPHLRGHFSTIIYIYIQKYFLLLHTQSYIPATTLHIQGYNLATTYTGLLFYTTYTVPHTYLYINTGILLLPLLTYPVSLLSIPRLSYIRDHAPSSPCSILSLFPTLSYINGP